MIVLLALTGGVRAARRASSSAPALGCSAGADHEHEMRARTRRRGATKLTSRAGVVGRRRLHDGRHHDAPEGARDRLRRRRLPRPCSCRCTSGTTCSSRATASGRASRTRSSVRSSRSSASCARSATCRWPPRSWHGGISFGGVISFIFADLIALPLVLIYRKYYGGRLTLRLVRVVLRGDGGRRSARRGPLHAVRRGPDRAGPETIVDDALPVELHDVPQHRVPGRVRGALLALPHRGRARRRATRTRSIPCARCRSRRRNAPAHSWYDGVDVWFCSDRCRERYESTTVKRVSGDRRASGVRDVATSRRRGSRHT